MASILKMPNKKYRATVRRKGFPQVNKTFDTKQEAKDWAALEEGKLETNPVVKYATLTVSDVLDRYELLRESKRPIVHGSNEDFQMRHLHVGLGTLNIHTLTVEQITAWVQHRLDNKGGANALGKEIVMLQTACARVSTYVGTKLRYHDSRHEGISRLFEMGYTIEEVAVFSGHGSWDNLKRYTHKNPIKLHDKVATSSK